MRILITGGAGFIGSHLAEACLRDGHEVFVLDDLSTGAIENIEHLRSRPHFHYFLDSVLNRQLTAELIDLCDEIYHLAAAVGVRLVVESPVRTIETNVRCTEVVLELAAKKRKRVLLTSTSEVYGKRTTVPFRESEDLFLGPPTKGRWSYACSKLLDEFLALSYWKEKRVETTIVRLFNTVGPRQTGRYGMVVPTFVRQGLAGRDITVFGDGEQLRCFLHVDDAVWALRALMASPASVGEVVNVGGTEEISIRELAEQVQQATGATSNIVYVPYAEAYEEGFEDMRRRVPDISKLHRITGFYPQRALDAILRDVIDFERSRLRAVARSLTHSVRESVRVAGMLSGA